MMIIMGVIAAVILIIIIGKWIFEGVFLFGCILLARFLSIIIECEKGFASYGWLYYIRYQVTNLLVKHAFS
jgi:hypothetical protein